MAGACKEAEETGKKTAQKNRQKNSAIQHHLAIATEDLSDRVCSLRPDRNITKEL
jgi:hypothetical protein